MRNDKIKLSRKPYHSFEYYFSLYLHWRTTKMLFAFPRLCFLEKPIKYITTPAYQSLIILGISKYRRRKEPSFISYFCNIYNDNCIHISYFTLFFPILFFFHQSGAIDQDMFTVSIVL